MRNLRPFRSSTVLISLRYQPPICAPVLPAGPPATRLAKYSAPAYNVSRLLGQLAARRHLSSGCDCAIAGAAIAAVASPTPPAVTKERRFILVLLPFPILADHTSIVCRR